jgi:hypothetical protein
MSISARCRAGVRRALDYADPARRMTARSCAAGHPAGARLSQELGSSGAGGRNAVTSRPVDQSARLPIRSSLSGEATLPSSGERSEKSRHPARGLR